MFVQQRGWLAGLLLLAIAAGEIAGIAQAQSTDRRVPGMQQADVHNPFSPGYVDMTPGGFTRRFSSGGFSFGSRNFFFGAGSAPGLWGGPNCFDFGCCAAPPYRLEYWVDPLPPRAPLRVGPLANLPGAGAGQGGAGLLPPQPNLPEKRTRQRTSSPQAVARAARMLGAGDEHFAAQRYRDANAQYRSATETASLTEAFFRRGQALLAMNQYELAGEAFKRGLRLGDKWPQASFGLAKLYGDNQVAKLAHLEALAAAAEDAPHDGTLLLMVGLQLYFDGQGDRAQPFFRKASELLPGDELNLDAVLQPGK